MERTSSANSERRSYEDLHIRTPDDIVLVLRKFDMHKSDAVLVVPDVNSTLEKMMPFVPSLLRCNVYILELRGHGFSEGRWSGHAQKTDIQYIVSLMKKKYRTFILAQGVSASIVLEGDGLGADGIIALSPRKSRPVKVQTPMIAVNTAFTSIFGNVRFFHAEHLQVRQTIANALHQLQLEERPIAVRRSPSR